MLILFVTHSGGTATTVLYPIEFLRTRLAMDVGSTKDTRQYPRGMRDVFSSTLKSDGMVGMYQGYGIAIFGVILYRALHLGGYDALKSEWLHHSQQTSDLTMGQRFATAQAVSLGAAVVCYPIDSIKRRLMMQSGLPADQRQYRNSSDCLRKILRQEGIRGFYLGMGPNLIRTIGAALVLVGYDTFKALI